MMPTRLLSILCFLAVGAVVSSCDLPSGVKEDEQVKTVLFEDRPDRRDDDYDREVGSEVTIEPWEAQVTTTEFRPEIDGQQAGYLVVHLTVKNVGVGKRTPSRFHWQLLTPSGELKNPAPVAAGEVLPEEELKKDEQASGVLVFTAGQEPGTFYVVFNPTKKDSDPRGVWGPLAVP